MMRPFVARLSAWLRWGTESAQDHTARRKILLCNAGALIGIVSLFLFDGVFLYSGSRAATLAMLTHLPFYAGFSLVPYLNRHGHALHASWLLAMSAMGTCLLPMLVAFGTYFDHHYYFILFAVAPSAIFPRGHRLEVALLFLLNSGLFLWFKTQGMAAAPEIELATPTELRDRLGMLLTVMVVTTLAAFFWSFDFVTHLSERELERMSMTDNLTQAANRHGLAHGYGKEMARAARSGSACSLALLDIDHFKRVNDLHGHDAGDMLLRQVAELCQRHLRAGSLVARVGGDEFAILMPDTHPAQAREALDRIRLAVAATRVAANADAITVSIGVASVPAVMTLEAALKAADRALYDAKQAGRNRVEINPAA